MEVLSAARLTVRLGAVRRNYEQIQALTGRTTVGAAVKANGYGLGAREISQTLYRAGCRDFFVAYVAEADAIRNHVEDSNVYVFNGAMPGTVEELAEKNFIPLIISLQQLQLWRDEASKLGKRLKTGLHFDTGMGRTGITPEEARKLTPDSGLLDGLDVVHVMSHLACADDLGSPQPEIQLARFRELRSTFSSGVASLANSAGTFRGPEFHFGMVRPGISIYGGSPLAKTPNPMGQTVVLEAPMLQIKDVQPGELVGYGATYEVKKPSRHVTVTVGYADGYLRSQSNSGRVSIGGHICPIVGRVSMDLTIVDATNVPEALCYLGAPVEMIGDHRLIDDVAADANTIANELLTDLGNRYDVVYSDD